MRQEHEIDDLRLDLHALRGMIDALLDEGRTGDPLLQACAAVCRDRQQRLEQLEALEEQAQPAQKR